MEWVQQIAWVPAFMGLLTAAMIAVIYLDITRYTIPNTLNLFLLGLYPFAVFLLGIQAWPMALVAAALVLALGLGIFALGFMGGGDIKLLVVLTLWIGWNSAALNFIYLTAIFGGVLVIIVLFARWIVAPVWRKISTTRSLPRILTARQPVPYGIAIAAAFLFLLWNGQVPVFN